MKIRRIWIAALAQQHELTLISRDEHFEEVDGLRRGPSGGTERLWRRAAALTEWHEPCDRRRSRTDL